MKFPIYFLFFLLINSISTNAQDVILKSQLEIDAFDQSITTVDGDLVINGTNSAVAISDLSNLSNISTILGSLSIFGCDSLLNLTGLSNIQFVEDELILSQNIGLISINALSSISNRPESITVRENSDLVNLDGFLGLTSVEKEFNIRDNMSLENLDGLVHISRTGYLTISENPNLSTLDGLNGLEEVSAIEISENNELLNLDGLSNLEDAGATIKIENNNKLVNIDALSNITASISNISIIGNNSLINIDGISNIESVRSSAFSINIQDNESLLNIDGLAGIQSIESFSIRIKNNPSLTNIDGFLNQSVMHSNLTIEGNENLTNLDGLQNIVSMERALYIQDNASLINIDGLFQVSEIGGDFYIINNPLLSNLNGLSRLDTIHQNLNIDGNNGLIDLIGLNNLTTIGVSLSITDNSQLSNLNGLSSLTTISGTLRIEENTLLKEIDALANLSEVNATLIIEQNDVLENLDGLSGLKGSIHSIDILFNNSLNNIDGLLGISSIRGDLDVSNNEVLTTLDGLENIRSIQSNLRIRNNPVLYLCCAIQELLSNPDSIGRDIEILNNASTCRSQNIILQDNCDRIWQTQTQVVLDTNSNGCDSMDLIIDDVTFILINNGVTHQYISNTNRAFKIRLDTGINIIKPELDNTNFDISPMEYIVNIPGDSLLLNHQFCVSIIEDVKDLEITMSPLMPARPGFESTYLITFKNSGTQVESGQITFEYPDETTTVLEALPTWDEMQQGIYRWNFEHLDPFEERSIIINLRVNSPMDIPPVVGGDLLSYRCTISPLLNDERPKNNIFSLNETVVNSFDPNDKTCLEGQYIDPEIIGEYIHYTIRFENTGTATAVHVNVRDSIDTTVFDINSLKILSSSHPCQAIIEENQILFQLNNIFLPFESENNRGHITFKLKTIDDITMQDTLENTADIFFDFNFPIRTNTTRTTFLSVGTSDQTASYRNLEIKPNPTTDILEITIPAGAMQLIQVIDTRGNLIKELTSTNKENELLHVSHIPNGIYIIRTVNTDGAVHFNRFIKISQ